MPPRTRSRNPQGRDGVFISYARSDGHKIAAHLRERLEAEAIPLWQDLGALEGGRDWWLQIIEALNHVEFMALVITPNALRSDTVRKEWRYARQEGVCVYPIKGVPDLDFATVPRWLLDKHFYDVENQTQWQKFLNDLNTRCEVPRIPFMVEDLPEDFVPRKDEFDQLLAYLRNNEDGGPIAITAALRGAGGYGKTTLAKALCHNEDVQDAFEDGILWVTLGETPGDLAVRVADLVETLSGERPGFSDVNTAAARLRELLADRDVLLVIDDVWNSAHLTPFMLGAGRGARLITTRNIDTLPLNAKRVDVDAMRRQEAVTLLGAGLPDVDKASLWYLAARLGEWPLLLKIVNGVLRHRVKDLGQNSTAALDWVNAALDRRGLTAFDARNPPAREQAVKNTLSVSIDLLDDWERSRYVELAVFPEDVDIPLATLVKFWAKSGLDDFDTEALCEHLDRLSLLQRFDPNRRVIGLHDVVRQYLIGEQRIPLSAVHNDLLNAHRRPQESDRPLADWAELPRDEPYLWDHLAYHLVAAEREVELTTTVKDLRYLASKTVARNPLAVERDLLNAEEVGPSDSMVRLLRRRFIQASHVMGRCKERRDAEATLYSRLVHEDQLTAIASTLAKAIRLPFLAPVQPLPDLPDPALIRTLSGHRSVVNGCTISRDGSLIASASNDQTAKVWDSSSGALLRTLVGHSGSVKGCAMSENGSLIVTASADHTLRLWDGESGEMLHILSGHGAVVNDCDISDDGSLIVSVSSDQTVKVWDSQNGELRHTLLGHKKWVNCCAISHDRSLIVSASGDRTLKCWDSQTGSLIRTLSGHTAGVNSCSISDDGSIISSASNDGTVRVWESASGLLLHTLTGHEDWVRSCAISDGGSVIVSASDDQTVKIWNGVTGILQRTLLGHSSGVRGCSITRDGSLIVSASNDRAVNVWDGANAALLRTPFGHTAGVNDCAITSDGSRILLASRDQTLTVWDSKNAELVRGLSGHTGSINGCAISADDSFIVSVSSDKTVRVWNSATGEPVRKLSERGGGGRGCDVSGDGSVIVSISSDSRTVWLWNSESDMPWHKLIGHVAQVNACAISRDGALIVSVSDDRSIKLWDVASGQLIRTLSGHRAAVKGCALSADGTLIVTASKDKTLKVWNLVSEEPIRTLRGHTGGVNGCALSTDGSVIVSISFDQTIRAWDTQSGECLAALHVDGPLSSCAIYKNGDLILAGGARGAYVLRLVS